MSILMRKMSDVSRLALKGDSPSCRRSLRRMPIILFSCLTFSSQVFVPAAQATHFGTYYADDSHHTFFFHGSMVGDYYNAMNSARGRLASQTVMTQSYQASYTNSVDVVSYALSLPSETYLGVANCEYIGFAGACDRWSIILNAHTLGPGSYTNKIHTALHEVGHTVGLQHTTPPCTVPPGPGFCSTAVMRQGLLANISFHSHEVRMSPITTLDRGSSVSSARQTLSRRVALLSCLAIATSIAACGGSDEVAQGTAPARSQAEVSADRPELERVVQALRQLRQGISGNEPGPFTVREQALVADVTFVGHVSSVENLGPAIPDDFEDGSGLRLYRFTVKVSEPIAGTSKKGQEYALELLGNPGVDLAALNSGADVDAVWLLNEATPELAALVATNSVLYENPDGGPTVTPFGSQEAGSSNFESLTQVKQAVEMASRLTVQGD